jgi:hypothetical protein
MGGYTYLMYDVVYRLVAVTIVMLSCLAICASRDVLIIQPPISLGLYHEPMVFLEIGTITWELYK